MRPRSLDKTRKRRGPEKAGKRPQSPAEVAFGSSERSWRGFGEVFKGLGKIERFWRGFGSREAPKNFFPEREKSRSIRISPLESRLTAELTRAPSCAGEP